MKYEDVREFFWPILDELTDDEKNKEKDKLDRDVLSIKNTNWNIKNELALEEARKLNELENQRRGSADSKAAIYLTAITALAPVLVSLIPGIISDGKNNIIIDISLFLIFIYALINLLRAAFWAFNTLKVSASNRVDIIDLVAIWGKSNDKYEVDLTIENLCAVRKNRDGVNRKVTCIKMTHELLLRTFLSFVFLLFVQASSSFISSAISSSSSSTILNSAESFPKLPINIYRL